MADDLASDNNALLLQVSQDLNKLRRDWDKANGIFDDAATKMERRAKKMGDTMEGEAGNAGKRAGQALAEKFTGEAGKAIVFNRMQMMELAHVGRSVADSLAAGISPTRILMLEGGRLAEVFGSTPGGFGGAMKALPGLVNPYTAALAALAVVLIGAVAAEQSYEKTHRQLLVTLMGTAGASGLTIKSLQDIAEAADKVNHASVSANLSAEQAFLTVGKLGKENLPSALGLLRDYAAATGQEVPAALQRLAKAFADPSKGALDLSEDLTYLNGEQLKTIQRLADSGDKAAAVSEMIKDLSASVHGAAGELNGLGAIMQSIGGFFKDAAFWVGQFTYNLTHVDEAGALVNLKQQLQQAEAKLKGDQSVRTNSGGLLNANGAVQRDERSIAALNAAIAKLEQAQKDAAARGATSRANANDLALQQDIDAADPQAALIRAKTAQRQGLNTDLLKAKVFAQFGETPQIRADAAAKIPALTHSMDVLDRSIKELTKKDNGIHSTRTRHAPADETKSAVGSADRARDSALAALDGNIDEKRQLEKDAVDDELNVQLASLAQKHIKLQADRDAAQTALRQAADLKKAKIDVDADNQLQRQKLDRERTRDELDIQILDLQAQHATTLKARVAFELQALDARKKLEDEERSAALDARKRLAAATDKAVNDRALAAADEVDTKRNDGLHTAREAVVLQVTPVVDDGTQKRANLQYNIQRQDILKQGPLNDYIKGIQDLDTEMESAGVRAIESLTDGLAKLIVTGGKLGDVLHQVLQQMELDLAKMAVQSAEKSVFALLGFDGGGYTGDGSRAGGVDGKGGFLAVLHPKETVIDHTKSGQVVRAATGSPSTVSAAAMPIVAGGPTFNLQGAVVTQDLLDQMNTISARHAQQTYTRSVETSRRAQQGWALNYSANKG